MNDSSPSASRIPAAPGLITSIGEGARHASIAQRVRLHQAALLDIMKSNILSRDLESVFAAMTAIAARTLGAARASIWRFTADRSALVLDRLFEVGTVTPQQGTQLAAAAYPAYFDALQWNRVISAVDAGSDPRTREFATDHLWPLGIVSMLDAAIWYSGKSQGVICIESANERRDWTPDEQQFAGSIADLIAMAIENESRRRVQSRLSVSEEMFSRVFRQSPDWSVITRQSDGALLDVNEAFEKQSGFTAAEVIGKTTLELGIWVNPEQRERWMREVSTHGRVRGMEAEFRNKAGEIRTYQGSSERIYIDGEACFISINRDVTESRRQQRLVFDIAQGVAAATGESFFRSLVERLSQTLDADMTFVGELSPDEEGVIRTIAVRKRDGAAENFTYGLDGSPCETILGRGVCAYPCNVAALFPRDKALAEKHIEGYVGAPLLDSAGRALGLIAVLFARPIENSDLAVNLLQIFAARASAELERRNQLAALEYRATHDLLTGLYNRSALEKQVDAAIAAGSDDVNALLLIDLDRFKEINDTLGHSVGDALLVKVAHRLASENDAGSLVRGQVARLGGDEFAIWLEKMPSTVTAEIIASRALAALTAPFEIKGYRLELGASVGIALHPDHGATSLELLRRADIAMYIAKRQGIGYAVYDAADDAYSPERLKLISELGAAVRGGQLELHFQPRLRLRDNVPTGFEVLVRWRHPTLGLLAPARFIPLAELSDIIRPLTLWVLDKALAQARQWADGGRSFRMAVNLSARHLMDDSCPEQIRRLLEKHQVAPDVLELEITESALITDPERATPILQRIHAMGVSISIDDFGTGFSSLSHLKRLPLSALKIDKSFVMNMMQNAQDATIVESTIGLAHNLGMSVIAEGIEDADTMARLRALGCDEGQGYLMAMPMPAAEADAWLAGLAPQ